MNKKITLIFGSAFLLVPLALSLTGCKKPGGESDRGTIFIQPYSRTGFGFDYITEIFNDWKRETGSTFNLKIDSYSQDSGASTVRKIRTGSNTNDIYLSGIPSFNLGFDDNPPILEDLSPLLDAKPDGNLTIREKIIDFNSWQKNASHLIWNEDDSISYGPLYVLPFTRTFTGWIFDYGAFVEKGLLEIADYSDQDVINQLSSQQIVYHTGTSDSYPGKTVLIFDSCAGSTYCTLKSGDIITSAGKDGKFGTYDDGQPQTWEDFDVIVDKLNIDSSMYKKPFVASNKLGETYLQGMVEEIFTQEAGLDTYYALTCFDSKNVEIPMDESTSEKITWKNAYKIYNSDYVNEKLQFALEKTRKYTQDSILYGTTTVNAAQSKFVNGGFMESDFCGMLYEGNWFESQAKSLLISAGQRKAGRGYGEVDYRFMCMPNSEDAAGIDGEGNGSVFTAPETGGIVVRKQPEDNPEKKEAIFSFIKYLLKDTTLSKITRMNGMILGYKYNMTQDDFSKLTPFTRNCFSLFQDTENVKCTPVATDILSQPFSSLDDTGEYKGNESSFLNYPLSNDACLDVYYANAFNKIAIPTICNNFKNRYDEPTWSYIYNTMKNKLKARR